MFLRLLEPKIVGKLHKGKAIILIGPRQVGKTTLILKILENKAHLFLNGDDAVVRNTLESANTETLKQIIGQHNIVFIDEAQRIEGIGLLSKIITDQIKNVQLILSGSSAFQISNALNEPLTGRKWEYNLYPLCWEEIENTIGYIASEQQLEQRLLYGFYPDIVNAQGEEKELLQQLVNSYLYKDLLSLSNIKKPRELESLVQALALQIGNEVNYSELAQTVGLDQKTVKSYIQLLEQGFVIFRLTSYSKNLRNEIKKNDKVYFWDVGVRNAVIGNFSSFDMRMDKGALWENFLVSERKKQLGYKNPFRKAYFWRTTQQQEVDFVETYENKVFGYEFKWNKKKTKKLPITFTKTYNATATTIHNDNFRDFVIHTNDE